MGSKFNPQLELPTTRQEAEAAGSKWYYTGVPCGRGHTRPRYTSTCQCLGCAETIRNVGNYHISHNRKVSEGKANISEKQRRNRIEEELELARIEKWYRGYDE